LFGTCAIDGVFGLVSVQRNIRAAAPLIKD